MPEPTIEVRIERDDEHDIVYVALTRSAKKRGSARKTIRVGDDVALDFGADGRLLGVEVMNASNVLRQCRSRYP